MWSIAAEYFKVLFEIKASLPGGILRVWCALYANSSGIFLGYRMQVLFCSKVLVMSRNRINTMTDACPTRVISNQGILVKFVSTCVTI